MDRYACPLPSPRRTPARAAPWVAPAPSPVRRRPARAARPPCARRSPGAASRPASAAASTCRRRWGLQDTGGEVSLYTILFHFKAVLWSLSSFDCHPRPATPTVLQYYCTPIAQYTPRHRPSLCMLYTIQYCVWQYRVKAKGEGGRTADPGSGPSERGEHRPIERGRRVCGFCLLPWGVARCGRSAGRVLCALWAVLAAVCVGGGTLWGKHIIIIGGKDILDAREAGLGGGDSAAMAR